MVLIVKDASFGDMHIWTVHGKLLSYKYHALYAYYERNSSPETARKDSCRREYTCLSWFRRISLEKLAFVLVGKSVSKVTSASPFYAVWKLVH